MRLVPLAALAAVAVASPAVSQTLTPAAFRDRLATAMATATGHATVVIDDRTFKTNASNGTELTVNTDNAYAQYLADPPQLNAVIARMVAALPGGDVGSEPVEQLVVIVRPMDYLKRSVGPGASLQNFTGPRPMAGDLSYFLAVDSSRTIRPASKGDLLRWKLNEDAAWKRAFANIRTRMGPLVMTHLGDEAGASGFGAESGLAPSLLAEPEFCSQSAPTGIKNEVILVYSKDMFLFSVPEGKTQTVLFWQTTAQEVTAGRSLSSTPLTCRGGKWTVATPP